MSPMRRTERVIHVHIAKLGERARESLIVRLLAA